MNSHGFIIGDMLKYDYPSGGRVSSDSVSNYFFVDEIPNIHNFKLGTIKGGVVIKDGSTPAKAALNGVDLVATNTAFSLGLTTGLYWIRTQAMINAGTAAIQMVVNFTEEGGGYDFAFVTNGYTGVDVRGGTFTTIPGLDLVTPRSPQHWRAMALAVRNFRPSGSEADYFTTTYGVYGVNNGGNFSTSAGDSTPFRDARFYASGRQFSTHRGRDLGRWWLRNNAFSEPNGDYTAGQAYGGYAYPSSMFGVSSSDQINGQDVLFNDGTSGYPFSGFYLISTNAKP
jgi:hypothetical protein